MARSKGGMAGTDPKTSQASVTLVYQVPPTTVENATYFALINSGARSIRVDHYPAGAPFDPATLRDGRPITVRGSQAAFLRSLRNGQGANVDWLTIRWVESADDGGWYSTEIGFNPRLVSEDQAIAFVNDLVTA